MISLTKVRDLTLVEPPGHGGPLYLSAASGLVDLGNHLVVIADDELHLGIFPKGSEMPGRLVRLFEGSLPAAKSDRKRRKPDLEVLLPLPDFAGEALLALGSGSTSKRCRAAAFTLNAESRLVRPPNIIDLRPLVEGLGSIVAGLNIEGATIGDELRLFHRGNNSFPDSLMIRLPLVGLLNALTTGVMEPARPLGIHRLDLGRVQGVPYSATDAAALPDGRTVVTAVAEDTEDSYADGSCVGAAIALIGRDMHIANVWPLDRPHKIEGVSVKIDQDRTSLTLVADADDPDIPASLYRATINI